MDNAERNGKSDGKLLETIAHAAGGDNLAEKTRPHRKKKSMAIREMVSPLRSTAPSISALYPLNLFFCQKNIYYRNRPLIDVLSHLPLW